MKATVCRKCFAPTQEEIHVEIYKNRRSIRLKDYDYRQPGAYFVTIVTQSRKNIFGEINLNEGDYSRQSPPKPQKYTIAKISSSPVNRYIAGEIVLECWKRIPRHFPFTQLDVFILIPNHFHAILWLLDSEEKSVGPGILNNDHHDPDGTYRRTKGTESGSLNAVIQNFKSISTRKINKFQQTPGNKIWQRGYYERVIRNERELNAIRKYIQANPYNWAQDSENPDLW